MEFTAISHGTLIKINYSYFMYLPQCDHVEVYNQQYSHPSRLVKCGFSNSSMRRPLCLLPVVVGVRFVGPLMHSLKNLIELASDTVYSNTLNSLATEPRRCHQNFMLRVRVLRCSVLTSVEPRRLCARDRVIK